jgi:hypothetical protein
LLKAHIDYLLMMGLLMISFLLFTHFRVSPPPLVVFAMCAGSFGNPMASCVGDATQPLPAADQPVRRGDGRQLYVDDDWLCRR